MTPLLTLKVLPNANSQFQWTHVPRVVMELVILAFAANLRVPSAAVQVATLTMAENLNAAKEQSDDPESSVKTPMILHALCRRNLPCPARMDMVAAPSMKASFNFLCNFLPLPATRLSCKMIKPINAFREI